MTYNFPVYQNEICMSTEAVNPFSHPVLYFKTQAENELKSLTLEEMTVHGIKRALFKAAIYHALDLPTALVDAVGSAILGTLSLTAIVFTSGQSERTKQWTKNNYQNSGEDLKLIISSIYEIALSVFCILLVYSKVSLFNVLSHSALHHSSVATLKNVDEIGPFFSLRTPDFVMESSDGLQLPFHKSVLFARSEYFKAGANFIEGQRAKFPTNLTYEELLAFRRFCYTGICSENMDVLIELLPFAHMIIFEDLSNYCTRELIKNFPKLSAETIGRLIHVEVIPQKLKNLCFDYMRNHPEHAYFIKINEPLRQDFVRFQASNAPPPHLDEAEYEWRHFKRQETGDVKFCTQGGEVFADRLVLAVKSPQLHEFFAKEENRSLKEATFNLAEFPKKSVEDLLDFIYRDHLPDEYSLNPRSGSHLLAVPIESVKKLASLLLIAEKILNKDFAAEILKKYIKSYSCLSKMESIDSDCFPILQTIGHNFEIVELVNACMQTKLTRYFGHDICDWSPQSFESYWGTMDKLFENHSNKVTHIKLFLPASITAKLKINMHTQFSEEAITRLTYHIKKLFEALAKYCPELEKIEISYTQKWFDGNVPIDLPIKPAIRDNAKLLNACYAFESIELIGPNNKEMIHASPNRGQSFLIKLLKGFFER